MVVVEGSSTNCKGKGSPFNVTLHVVCENVTNLKFTVQLIDKYGILQILYLNLLHQSAGSLVA